jgi:hypothetical protein
VDRHSVLVALCKGNEATALREEVLAEQRLTSVLVALEKEPRAGVLCFVPLLEADLVGYVVAVKVKARALRHIRVIIVTDTDLVLLQGVL